MVVVVVVVIRCCCFCCGFMFFLLVVVVVVVVIVAVVDVPTGRISSCTLESHSYLYRRTTVVVVVVVVNGVPPTEDKEAGLVSLPSDASVNVEIASAAKDETTWARDSRNSPTFLSSPSCSACAWEPLDPVELPVPSAGAVTPNVPFSTARVESMVTFSLLLGGCLTSTSSTFWFVDVILFFFSFPFLRQISGFYLVSSDGVNPSSYVRSTGNCFHFHGFFFVFCFFFFSRIAVRL